LDGPSNEWQEGPGLYVSVWRYRWLVAVAVLVGGLAAFVWSSRQRVRYQGEVRVLLETGGDNTPDPGRVVRSEAEFLTAPVVLDRATALTGHRLASKELRDRLTVEPATDADLITIRVLEATPQGAAKPADTVVLVYREIFSEQTASGAKQEIAGLERRQEQLGEEIKDLRERLRVQPEDPVVRVKQRELDGLAGQIEAVRRSARDGGSLETVREQAAVPYEPAQPKPLRTAAISALLAFFAAAGLAWWLSGRRLALERQGPSHHGLGGTSGEERAGLQLSSPTRLAARLDEGRTTSSNGARVSNGYVSVIADFDQIANLGPGAVPLPGRSAAAAVRRGPSPDGGGGDRTLVPGRPGRHPARQRRRGPDDGERRPPGEPDGHHRSWCPTPHRGGGQQRPPAGRPRRARPAGPDGPGGRPGGLDRPVPLVRDQVRFGVLLAGRRRTDERVAPLTDHEVHEIADSMRDIMVPYLWAWLLLRNLKLRLGTLQ
jgi:hypothetical protein